MKFGEDVENISKILFLNFNIFRKFKVPNVFCLAVRNFLLRLLPDTVVLCHIYILGLFRVHVYPCTRTFKSIHV